MKEIWAGEWYSQKEDEALVDGDILHCDLGWVLYQGQCLLYLGGLNLNYFQAVDHCLEKGGFVYELLNHEKFNNEFKDLNHDQFWTGFTSFLAEPLSTISNKMRFTVRSSDGVTFDSVQKNYQTPQKDSSNAEYEEGLDCLIKSTKTYSFSDCGNTKNIGTICQKTPVA